MESREWRIVGPAKWLLTKQEVCFYLGGIENRTLERFIARGQFPQGQLIGKQLTWTALDVACYVHLRGRFSTPGTATQDDESTTQDD